MVFFTPTLAVFILYYLYKFVSYNNSFNEAKGISIKFESHLSSKVIMNRHWGTVIGNLQLFKSWIALSPAKITIQGISIGETNCAIPWIEIYPSDSIIHLFNNWGHCT